MKKILYISRKATRCGVHDYGERIVKILKNSTNYKFVFGYPNDRNEMLELIAKHNPQGIIYNYYNSTLYWLNQSLTNSLELPQIIIYHEFSVAFQPHGVCTVDPTIVDDPKNNVVSLPRPLHDHFVHKNVVKFDKPSIGSFGFGCAHKNFPEIARLVKDQFDKAIIRLNIPFYESGDISSSAKEEVRKIKNILEGTDIELEVSHEFLDQQDIFDFLSNNDINLFLYDIVPGKSIASAPDYALAVKKPIGLSRSNMFNHFHKHNLDIYVDSTPIKNIIDKGIKQLEPMYNEHCDSNILEKIETVLNTAFLRFKGDIL